MHRASTLTSAGGGSGSRRGAVGGTHNSRIMGGGNGVASSPSAYVQKEGRGVLSSGGGDRGRSRIRAIVVRGVAKGLVASIHRKI